jgi:hypothetical protein
MGLSCRLRRSRPLLKMLVKASPNKRKAILQVGGKDLVYAVCECCMNVLKPGTVPLTKAQKKSLLKFKRPIRKLADKRVAFKEKHRLISQSGGFLAPLLAVLAPVLSTLLGGR